MANENLLKLRKQIKSRKPAYNREDSHKKAKLEGLGWRRPKGHHSKMRHGIKGKNKLIEVGYGSPRAVKGLHKSGLREVLIHNVNELEKIKSKEDGIVIASVGLRNKMDIVREAEKKKLTILNLKNPSEFLKKSEELLKSRKESKQEVSKEKKEKKSVEKKVEELSEEEKKIQEKKEKDKLLTQKM